MKTLTDKEIIAIRILSGHLRDIDCYQKPTEIKADLHNIAEQLYNLTLETVKTGPVDALKAISKYCSDHALWDTTGVKELADEAIANAKEH